MRRNKFSLSNHKLATFDMGELVPVNCMEVIPGDSIQQATSALLRVSPQLRPVMHPVDARIHHWFVPYRLIWNDWENFITGGEDGADTSTLPTITFGSGVAEGTLGDYLGVPVTGASITVNALPFRAYAKIYNEHYRDQDLQTALTIDLTDGADTTTSTALKNANWEKDFFTTCRPWTQKGSAVSLPLGSTANLTASGPLKVQDSGGTYNRTITMTNATTNLDIDSNANGSDSAHYNAGLQVDLTNATAATVNQVREAFALQKLAEARALYGGRYIEYLRYLGVNPQDSRLQRPEYLGGGKQTVQFSEVLQTGQDFDANSGVGQLRGHGIAAMRSNRYRRFFPEHGLIITLASVKPKTIYNDGLGKFWSYSAKEDFHTKELEHIGQDEVLNKEIYAKHSAPTGVFGYQNRYDQYRRMESSVAGEFRSSTKNDWHLARVLTSDPSLNDTFITCTPSKRVLLDQTNDSMIGMFRHSIQARRPISRKGEPL